jgi:transposase-like protein
MTTLPSLGLPVLRALSLVRRVAKQAKDSGQARRLLAIAAVLEGASREDAAKIGGMDRQTLRDWVIRFNEQGPDLELGDKSLARRETLKGAYYLRLADSAALPHAPTCHSSSKGWAYIS